MRTFMTILFFIASYFAADWTVTHFIGSEGLVGAFFDSYSWVWYIGYTIVISHLTITAMSLSFHRSHTHKGVEFNPYLDMLMQVWLWCVTSMSKPDWVSVHVYHHAHSDTDKDPHSPVKKGFWRVFLLGVFDYSQAKSWPDVLKIRKTIKLNKLEKFISENLFFGPYIFSCLLLVLFGGHTGLILLVTNFLISPLFAVGGVNALAHTWGYRNHLDSGDNSRNIGFLFPLNFIICGELDHNNHHAHQRSASFRHKWYEFDIGWAYIWTLAKFKLANVRHSYTTLTLKQDMSRKVKALIERDSRFKQKLEEMAKEYHTSAQELRDAVEAYIQGQKVKFNGQKIIFDARMKAFIEELQRTVRINEELGLVYA
ncbi:MAG: fatty acid desaturase [Bacteriovoracaceae bacterium]|nr:fatty acid desaturase [Bacteriovoracaceae bacterium]